MSFPFRSLGSLAGLLTVLLAAPPPEARAARLRSQPETASASRGKHVYNRACAGCHGRSGRGDGPAAEALDPRPRDLTSGKFKFRSTPTGSPPTDADLFRTLSEGIPRTYMVGWDEMLSERDRWDVIAYVKTLSDVFDLDATPVAIPAPSPETPASLSEGKHVYMILQCWSCHGVSGRGDGRSADSLTDDWGRKIDAFDFTVGHYKGGGDGKDVFRTFETGLNGTPMPSYADAFLFGRDSVSDFAGFREVYPDSEVAALEAYLGTEPSGSELSAMAEADRSEIAARRKWALVHYVRSLTRKPGLMDWLFATDTETSRQ